MGEILIRIQIYGGDFDTYTDLWDPEEEEEEALLEFSTKTCVPGQEPAQNHSNK